MNYGRYQVIEAVGQGSMGVVYRAHDPQIDREVALKVLRRDRITGEEFVNRFLKEARVIGRLSHPNIVTVYDVGQEGPDLYIAMEFIEGSPLNDILRVISLSLERMIEIGIQTALTLDYAHQKGVVHRDIKPSNILLQPDKNIILTDFGIAHLEGSTDTMQTREGDIIGTPAYMSPEQVMGKAVDGRADIFSLGAVLYELTTGARPFGGGNGHIATVLNAIMSQEPREPAAMSEHVAKDLSAVIMKCLRKDPAERYQTGGELAQALTRCLTELRAEEPGPQPVEKKKKTYWIPAAMAAVAVIISAAGIYFYTRYADSVPGRTIVKEESVAPSPAPLSAAPPETSPTTPVLPGPEPAAVPVAVPPPPPDAQPAREAHRADAEIGKRKEKRSTSVFVPANPSDKRDVVKKPKAAKGVKPAVSLAAVTILSTPPGARVFIDEKSKGTTPLTLMLPVGRHYLRMSLPGFREVRRQVTIEDTMEYPLSFQLKSAGESD